MRSAGLCDTLLQPTASNSSMCWESTCQSSSCHLCHHSCTGPGTWLCKEGAGPRHPRWFHCAKKYSSCWVLCNLPARCKTRRLRQCQPRQDSYTVALQIRPLQDIYVACMLRCCGCTMGCTPLRHQYACCSLMLVVTTPVGDPGAD